MDQEKVIEVAKNYKRIIQKYIHPQKVILFGSYVSGTPRLDSDIDIAILVDHLETDWLSMASLLHKLTVKVDVRIEPLLLEEKNDASGFATHIVNTGIEI